MQDFRKLDVWHRAHSLTIRIYGCSRCFSKDEKYGLTSQLRRSCSSIGANIAEGCGRSTAKDMARFLQIALGSANEVENHLVLSRDLNYLNDPLSKELLNEIIAIQKMLGALLKKINQPT